MKPTVPAFLAIILCGVLNFYWFQSRQSNPALPPQTPQGRTQADSKASPSIPKQESVSKIEIAVNGIAQKITASPLGHSTIILFVFDENRTNPPARANTHVPSKNGRENSRPASKACLANSGAAHQLAVYLPESKDLDIKNAGGGFQYLAQIDVNKLGSCGLCAPHSETEEL